jgi:hypothetical protein
MTQRLLLANCAAAVLLAAAVYLTRARSRRVAGALCGGVVAAVLAIGEDVLAHGFGWWWYPGVSTAYGPPLAYLAIALWYGAGVALIGWRITRRFPERGLGFFIAAVAVLGPLRDYGLAARVGAVAFADGLAPVVADAVCWAGVAALAQAVMRAVAGPAAGDRLARRRR